MFGNILRISRTLSNVKSSLCNNLNTLFIVEFRGWPGKDFPLLTNEMSTPWRFQILYFQWSKNAIPPHPPAELYRGHGNSYLRKVSEFNIVYERALQREAKMSQVRFSGLSFYDQNFEIKNFEEKWVW